MLNLVNRGQYPTPVEDEFQHLVSQLRGLLSNLLDVNGNLLPGETPSGLTPIGTILSFAGTIEPAGWLIADGRAVSRVTYAALFRVIGATYGAGDGSTSFNLPDLRQRFVLGKATTGTGAVLGETGGTIDQAVTAHTHTISSDGSHSHSGSVGGGGGHSHSVSVSGTTGGANSELLVDTNADGVSTFGVSEGHTHNFSGSGSTGTESNHSHSVSSDGAHSHGGVTGSSGDEGIANPPYMALNMIIFAGA